MRPFATTDGGDVVGCRLYRSALSSETARRAPHRFHAPRPHPPRSDRSITVAAARLRNGHSLASRRQRFSASPAPYPDFGRAAAFFCDVTAPDFRIGSKPERLFGGRTSGFAGCRHCSARASAGQVVSFCHAPARYVDCRMAAPAGSAARRERASAAFTRGMTSVAISSMDRFPMRGSTQSMPP